MNVEKHVLEVCQPATTECCAYLAVSSDGWECCKISSLRSAIDLRLSEGTMRATGDNCPGRDLAPNHLATMNAGGIYDK